MGEFTQELLAGLGPDMVLGPEVIALMEWLEDEQGNLMRYTSTNEPFLPTTPMASIDALWSHLAFVIDPDMFKYWMGREDLGNTLVSILRCGGDGSHMALWRDPDGKMKYVFAGSEGDAFVVADTALGFVQLITLGYESIEARESLDDHPAEFWQEYNDSPWPDTKTAKAWIKAKFGVDPPHVGADLLPQYPNGDPFNKWVAENNKN